MYGYDSKILGYHDNLSISSTDTAVPTPPTSLSSGSAASASASHSIFKMDSAFMPEDPAHFANQTAAYSPVDPGSTAAAEMLMEHHHQHHLHHGQHQHLARFSTGSDSRTQTPPQKRLREGDDSDAGESEANPRIGNFNGSGDGDGISGALGDDCPGDKRAGRRKIKIEFIEDKSRRHITFSKRKAGIMKKAYELSTLTGTQVLLLVVSETGLVYTFTTPKLQPIVTQCDGKNLIQSCLSVPDQPGDRIPMPIPTESNTFMSQPRHSGNHTPNAISVAAASGVALTDPHDLHHRFADEHKPDLSSPVANGLNPAAATSYLQYSYAHNTIAQAAVAAAVGPEMTPVGSNAYATGVASHSAGNSGIQQYHAAAAAAAAASAVPGYASYPGSTTQSQHHSPITSATQHNTPQPASGISAVVVAAASSIPGMGSLASYHHQGGYSHSQQQQQQQSHYGYHQPQVHQQYYQPAPHPHYTHQQQSQGSTPGTPVMPNASVNAAVVAAVAAAGAHQGSYYWPHTASTVGLASPHHHHHHQSPVATSQQQQQQQASSAALLQRTGYANGN